MANKLKGKKIAFLLTDGFEQIEFTQPWEEIKAEGAEVTLVSLKAGKIQGFHHNDKADKFKVDMLASKADANDFDGLVLPGGVINPDALRLDKDAVKFTQDFFKQYKPVASICHGPIMLIEADVLEDRKLTSWPSIRTDIENAGAEWVDEKVVVDAGLVTSRKPEDLKFFCEKAIEEFAAGRTKQRRVA